MLQMLLVEIAKLQLKETKMNALKMHVCSQYVNKKLNKLMQLMIWKFETVRDKK